MLLSHGLDVNRNEQIIGGTETQEKINAVDDFLEASPCRHPSAHNQHITNSHITSGIMSSTHPSQQNPSHPTRQFRSSMLTGLHLEQPGLELVIEAERTCRYSEPCGLELAGFPPTCSTGEQTQGKESKVPMVVMSVLALLIIVTAIAAVVVAALTWAALQKCQHQACGVGICD